MSGYHIFNNTHKEFEMTHLKLVKRKNSADFKIVTSLQKIIMLQGQCKIMYKSISNYTYGIQVLPYNYNT